VTWNDMLDNLRQRLRRTIGRDRGGALEPARSSPRLEQLGDRPLATPAADVYENDRELLFLFDVPGGSRDGATVVWTEREGLKVLVRSQGLPQGQRWASEYEPADWYRAFALPDQADGSKAVSAIVDGVLTVRVPKRGNAAKLVPIRGT
jgi:HSP20 family molecular chaperone IbpA